ncbi:hypothetical protein FGD77_08250 [Roseovarius sp. M141]|nr:hypothetical protein [Roseovarius sp. M141]
MTQTDAAPTGRRTESSENVVAAKILLTVLVALVAWGLCVFIWGVPGLYLPALAMVPVIWIALIAITLGK